MVHFYPKLESTSSLMTKYSHSSGKFQIWSIDYRSQKLAHSLSLCERSVYMHVLTSTLSFRIMNQLRVNAERNGDYTRAKMMKLRFEEFSRAEQQRQEQNMRLA